MTYKYSRERFPNVTKIAQTDDERLLSDEYYELVHLLEDYDEMAYRLNGLDK